MAARAPIQSRERPRGRPMLEMAPELASVRCSRSVARSRARSSVDRSGWLGSLARHRSTIQRSGAGVWERAVADRLGLLVQDRRRACRSPSSSGTPACRSPSRRASSRTRTGPTGSRPAARSPAPATCSRPSRRRRPGVVPVIVGSCEPSSLPDPVRGQLRQAEVQDLDEPVLRRPSRSRASGPDGRSRPRARAPGRPRSAARSASSFLIGSAPPPAAPAASSRPPAPSRCTRRRSSDPMS